MTNIEKMKIEFAEKTYCPMAAQMCDRKCVCLKAISFIGDTEVKCQNVSLVKDVRS